MVKAKWLDVNFPPGMTGRKATEPETLREIWVIMMWRARLGLGRQTYERLLEQIAKSQHAFNALPLGDRESEEGMRLACWADIGRCLRKSRGPDTPHVGDDEEPKDRPAAPRPRNRGKGRPRWPRVKDPGEWEPGPPSSGKGQGGRPRYGEGPGRARGSAPRGGEQADPRFCKGASRASSRAATPMGGNPPARASHGESAQRETRPGRFLLVSTNQTVPRLVANVSLWVFDIGVRAKHEPTEAF